MTKGWKNAKYVQVDMLALNLPWKHIY